MGPAAGFVAIAALAVGAFATFKQIKAQKKSAKAQKAQQRNAIARQRRQTIREGQIKRAAALASAEAVGAGESSAVLGGVASVTSRVGEKISFSNQQSVFSNRIADAQQTANLFSGISSISSQVFQAAGGFGSVPGLGGGATAAPSSVNLTGPIGS